MDEPTLPPAAVPPLGPGADDPRSPAVASSAERAATLGPGDDDPRSPVTIVGPDTSRAPLAPGASDGDNPDDAFHFLAPVPAGPGDAAFGARHVVRIPKVSEPEAPAPVVDEVSTRRSRRLPKE